MLKVDEELVHALLHRDLDHVPGLIALPLVLAGASRVATDQPLPDRHKEQCSAADCVPSIRYVANSAWRMFSVLAFNLVRGFQTATTAQHRRPTHKRGTVYLFETIHTLRALCLQRAGIILRRSGYPTLDVGRSPAIKDRFQRLDRPLDAA